MTDEQHTREIREVMERCANTLVGRDARIAKLETALERMVQMGHPHWDSLDMEWVRKHVKRALEP